MLTPLLPGEDSEKLGGFTLFGRLGVGGIERVYLAADAENCAAAVKRIHRGIARNSGFSRRFALEIHAMAQVVGRTCRACSASGQRQPCGRPHPTSRGLGRRDGQGMRRHTATQRRTLPRRGDPHRAEGRPRRGFRHRDLTPTNVLISAWRPQVIDMGLGRCWTQDGPGGWWATRWIIR